MSDKQPVTENLPTIAELRAEIIIELTCDIEDERDDCIDAKLLNDRLTVAEAVREACAAVLDEWYGYYPTDVFTETPPGEHGETVDACSASMARHVTKYIAAELRAIDLAEIVKGKP